MNHRPPIHKIFEKLSKEKFEFLEKIYNLCIETIDLVENKGIIIKYGSKDVFVKLAYGSPSFELHFTFGIKGQHDLENSIPLNSGDLVLFEKNRAYKNSAAFSATSYENLTNCLPKLAELLQNCGSEYLKGNLKAYSELEKKRDEEFANFSTINSNNFKANSYSVIEDYSNNFFQFIRTIGVPRRIELNRAV